MNEIIEPIEEAVSHRSQTVWHSSTLTSEHQRETAFLRHCIRYDDSPRRQELDERITQIQRDERCVRRAVWLMLLLGALAVASLTYPAILEANFPYNAPQFIVNLIFAVGVASLISLLVFVGLGLVFRKKLNQRREECRQLVTRLLESRLGKPATPPWRGSRVGDVPRGTVQAAAGGNGCLDGTESMA
jgi:hypothetical protein